MSASAPREDGRRREMNADVVRKHIAANATKKGKGWWLPAVWSEGNPTLRAALVEELGRPIPSGYMSEEWGWEIDPEDYGLMEVDEGEQ